MRPPPPPLTPERTVLEPTEETGAAGAPHMDPTELERLLETLHAKSFAWALVCCGHDRADAEDALQSAYLRILDGRARYGERSSFSTWLFGVIRRTGAEERRKR